MKKLECKAKLKYYMINILPPASFFYSKKLRFYRLKDSMRENFILLSNKRSLKEVFWKEIFAALSKRKKFIF